MPLIQCLTPFPGGTKLPHRDRVYHFVRNPVGAYVADVMERDVEAVLSISAGYVRYDEDHAKPSDEPLARREKVLKKAIGEDAVEERTTAFLQPATREPDKPLHRPTRGVDPRPTAEPPPQPKAKVKTNAKTTKKGAKVVKTPAKKAAE
jgi:hypothetical protein